MNAESQPLQFLSSKSVFGLLAVYASILHRLARMGLTVMAHVPKPNSHLVIVDHPLIAHLLAVMRDKRCPHSEFRHCAGQIATFLTYEAVERVHLPEVDVLVEMPTRTQLPAKLIASERVALIAVLRSGGILASAAHVVLPRASFGHVGWEKDADKPYICKFPRKIKDKHCLVYDPVIATGVTAIKLLHVLRKKRGHLKDVVFITFVCAPEGLAAVGREFPEVLIITASRDERINSEGRVVPGLGDSGRRLFEAF